MRKRIVSLALTLCMLMSVVVVANTTAGAVTVPPGWERVVIYVGNRDVFMNGQWQANAISAEPFVVDAEGGPVVMIPTDAADLDSRVEWSVDGDTVRAQHGDYVAYLTVGSYEMTLGEAVVTLPVAPVRNGDSIFVPIMSVVPMEYGIDVRNVAWCEDFEIVVFVTHAPLRTIRITGLGELSGQIEAWYGSDFSLRIARNILANQRDCGGWRQWASTPEFVNYTTRTVRDQHRGQSSRTDASLDNGNMVNEIEFLVRMYQALGHPEYRVAYERAIRSIINGQYDNGGVPQRLYRPDTFNGDITFNDNVMRNVMNLWRTIMRNNDNAWHSVSDELLAEIRDSFDRALAITLDLQIWSETNQIYTGWGGQHNRNYPHEPIWARQFEPPVVATGESVTVLNFLMQMDPERDGISDEMWERIQTAVHHAALFFASVEFIGHRTDGSARDMVLANPWNAALFPRFACPETFLAVFGYNWEIQNNSFDRYEFDPIWSYERISAQRRGSYHFFGAGPAQFRLWRNFDPENADTPAPVFHFELFTPYINWLNRLHGITDRDVLIYRPETGDVADREIIDAFFDVSFWSMFTPMRANHEGMINPAPGETFNLNTVATNRNPNNVHGMWDVRWEILDDGGTGAVLNEERTIFRGVDGERILANTYVSTITTENEGLLTVRASQTPTISMPDGRVVNEFMPIRRTFTMDFVIPVGNVEVPEVPVETEVTPDETTPDETAPADPGEETGTDPIAAPGAEGPDFEEDGGGISVVVWIVIGGLVVVGIIAAVVVATRKKAA